MRRAFPLETEGRSTSGGHRAAGNHDSSSSSITAKALQQLIQRGAAISGAFASAKWPAFSTADLDHDGWADFQCEHCGRRVARGTKHIPDSCFTMLFLGCKCGTVTFFEGDPGSTNAKDWRAAVEVMRVSGAEILVLNLNPSDEGSLGRN